MSSPVTRLTSRAAAAALFAPKKNVNRSGNYLVTMESSAAMKPQMSKSTAPSAVTLDGTSY